MTVNDVRRLAMSLSGTSESRPFAPDRVVFKSAANNKVFAILSGHEFPEDQVTVKADPNDVILLTHQYRSVGPAYKQNKKHWVNVVLDGDVPQEMIESMIKTSYAFVIPKNKIPGNAPALFIKSK